MTWKIYAQRSLVEKCKLFLLAIEATLRIKYAISVTFSKLWLSRFSTSSAAILNAKVRCFLFVSFYISVLFYVGVIKSFGIFSFKIFGIISILLTLNQKILFWSVYKVVRSKFELNLNSDRISSCRHVYVFVVTCRSYTLFVLFLSQVASYA